MLFVSSQDLSLLLSEKLEKDQNKILNLEQQNSRNMRADFIINCNMNNYCQY